jgi:hypothetical protein
MLLLPLLLQHPRSGCDVCVTIRWRTAPRFPELPPNSFIHCTGGEDCRQGGDTAARTAGCDRTRSFCLVAFHRLGDTTALCWIKPRRERLKLSAQKCCFFSFRSEAGCPARKRRGLLSMHLLVAYQSMMEINSAGVHSIANCRAVNWAFLRGDSASASIKAWT